MKSSGIERIVRGADAELHRHVKAGRRLARARDAHQDDVGIGQVARGDAVVVAERVVHGVDAMVVVDEVAHAVAAADRVRGAHAQLLLERAR